MVARVFAFTILQKNCGCYCSKGLLYGEGDEGGQGVRGKKICGNIRLKTRAPDGSVYILPFYLCTFGFDRFMRSPKNDHVMLLFYILEFARCSNNGS